MIAKSHIHPSDSCSICGATCASYSFFVKELTNDKKAFVIELRGFTQNLSRSVSEEEFNHLQSVLKSNVVKKLYEFDVELAPYYCPKCNLNYCKDHWQRQITYEGVFYDAEIGICPKGHRRMLFD